jgi:hypothetical protein
MNKLTSLLVAILFMFQSTAIFAKAVSVEDKIQSSNVKMIKTLKRKLKREVKRKNKTDIKKVLIAQRNKINFQFTRLSKKVVNETPMNELEDALYKLNGLHLSALETLDRRVTEAKTYETYLRELLLDLDFELNDDGSINQNNSQSVIISVLIILGLTVGGAGGLFLLFMLILMANPAWVH